MVAYTDSFGINKGSIALVGAYTNRCGVIEYTIDFAKIAAARTAAGVAALAATDTLVLATLPKGTLIMGGSVRLVTAEGAAGTIDLGITGSLTLFASNFDVNGTAGTIAGATTPSFLTADTNVVMTIDTNSIDVAKVVLSIATIDLGTNIGSIPSPT